MSSVDDSLCFSSDIPVLAPNSRSDDTLIDQISSFERAFCSDFVCVCCSIRLSSLHGLLEHVEERHAEADGTVSYPPKVEPLYSESDTSTQHWIRLEPKFPSASPPPPLHLSNSQFSEFDDMFVVEYQYMPYHEWENTHDSSFSECSTPALSAPSPSIPPTELPSVPPSHSYPPPHDIMSSPSLHPVLAPGQAQTDTLSPLSSSDGTLSPPPPSLKELRPGEVGPIRTASTARARGKGKAKGSSAAASVASKAQHSNKVKQGGNIKATRKVFVEVAGRAPTSKARSGYGIAGDKPTSKKKFSKKEKCHKCPTIGCTKAYLNANGLKYHQEKGTCTFDSESPLSEESVVGGDDGERRDIRTEPSSSQIVTQQPQIKLWTATTYNLHPRSVAPVSIPASLPVPRFDSGPSHHYALPAQGLSAGSPKQTPASWSPPSLPSLVPSSSSPQSSPAPSSPITPATPITPTSIHNSLTSFSSTSKLIDVIPPALNDNRTHMDTPKCGSDCVIPAEREISESSAAAARVLVPPFRTHPFKEVLFASKTRPFRLSKSNPSESSPDSCDFGDADAEAEGDGKSEDEFTMEVEVEVRDEPKFPEVEVGVDGTTDEEILSSYGEDERTQGIRSPSASASATSPRHTSPISTISTRSASPVSSHVSRSPSPDENGLEIDMEIHAGTRLGSPIELEEFSE